jgi:uncharacterized protein
VTCTTCGASVDQTASICPVCGDALTTSAHDPAASDPAASDPAASDPAASDRVRDPVWSPAPSGVPGGDRPSGAGVGAGGSVAGGGAWSPPPGTPGPAWGTSPPHPSGLSSEVRNWGLAAHLSAYLGAWVALAFIGPLVVWLLKRDDHPFIDHHAKEALNFNISFLLYGIVGGVIAIPIGLLTLGVGLIPIILAGVVLVVIWLIFPILAAVKAANGEGYRYPLTIRFVS